MRVRFFFAAPPCMTVWQHVGAVALGSAAHGAQHLSNLLRVRSGHRFARRYVTGTEWLSGCYDGSVALWSQAKKKPVCRVKEAHSRCAVAVGPVATGGAGGVDEAAAAWVQSVAVCPGANLAVRLRQRSVCSPALVPTHARRHACSCLPLAAGMHVCLQRHTCIQNLSGRHRN
jgi:hypothetical protein